MNEPLIVYTVVTDTGIDAPDVDTVQLLDAYRAAVSTALQLQRMLNLPTERRAVLEPGERRAFRHWRDDNGG